jgi:hypothetical protein
MQAIETYWVNHLFEERCHGSALEMSRGRGSPVTLRRQRCDGSARIVGAKILKNNDLDRNRQRCDVAFD